MLLSLGVKPVHMYISFYLISKREVILSIISVKSETALLVCVSNLLKSKCHFLALIGFRKFVSSFFCERSKWDGV